MTTGIYRNTDINKMRRVVIDLIAESRSRSIRVALFGSLLHRPDPDGVESQLARDSQLSVLHDTVCWIERVAQFLETGADPWNELPTQVANWTAEFVNDRPDIKFRMRLMANQSESVARSAEALSNSLGQALRDHYELRRGGFMEVVTEFCDNMWAEIDAQRDNDVARAKKTSQAIQDTLGRLEEIGTQVHLVSINASIEAARMGEIGAGVGILATEFRRLADEAHGLATSAKADIAGLLGSDTL